MRIFKATYRGRDDQIHKTVKWYLDFLDALGRRRRIPAERCTTKKQAETYGDNVEQLVLATVHKEKPGTKLDAWLTRLPKSTLRKFAEIGILDERYSVGAMPLVAHLQDFETWLRTTLSGKFGCRRSPRYVTTLMTRLRRVFDECGWAYWTDISKPQFDMWLGSFQPNASARTCNGHINAVRFFTRWMVDEVCRANEDPLRKVKYMRKQQKTIRRGLDADEIQRLLEATRQESRRGGHGGVTGIDRCVLYIVAVETGFRVRELRSLRVSDFDFDSDKPWAFRAPAVRLAAEFCKNRKRSEQALRRDRAEQLQAYFAGRGANEKAFNVPDNTYITRVFRADLAAAGIPKVDVAGKVLCFHSLRHSLATALDVARVSLKTRIEIMRHSTEGRDQESSLTVGTYTNEVSLAEKRDAMETLPAYPWPIHAAKTEQKEAVA